MFPFYGVVLKSYKDSSGFGHIRGNGAMSLSITDFEDEAEERFRIWPQTVVQMVTSDGEVK